MNQTRMNWSRMIRTAAGAGLTPQDFWRLSLAEWLALTAPDRSAMTRRELMTADVVSVGGLVFVGLRLAFDIWKHFDNRRGRRNG